MKICVTGMSSCIVTTRRETLEKKNNNKKRIEDTQGNSFHILPHDYLINLHLLACVCVSVMTTNVYQILNYHPFNFRGCRVYST